MFNCPWCTKAFSCLPNLDRHMITHTKEKPHKCFICQKAFSVLSNLDRHMGTHTKKGKPHKCPMCQKAFSVSSNLDRHMGTHTKEKPHKCPMCQKAFGQKESVKQHLKTVHDGVKRTKNEYHYCQMCSYKCSAKSLLQIHLQKHSAELPFSCHQPGCGYRTTRKHSLSQHALYVHSDKRPFKCPSDGCSYKAKTRTQMTSHLRVHSSDKPFACIVPGCNYTCKCKGDLKSHNIRIHSNEKPFKCSVCDFRTKCLKNLRLHEITHTKTKRFHCQAPNCGYASHHKAYLKKHFDSNHRKQEILCTEPRCNFRCGSVALLKAHLKRHKLPMLKCPEDSCGFRTKYNHCLLEHISRRHSELQSSVPVAGKSVSDLNEVGTMNTLQCRFPDCSFQTKFQKHYDRHVVTHNKEEKREHVCSFCFFRFSHLRALRSHIQMHTGEKPYSCSHCKYSTVNNFNLRSHAKRVHNIFVVPSGEEDDVRKCRTCSKTFWSYSELVLHSITHLQPAVVLQQLKLQTL